MKVICVGFWKTGTKSMSKALKVLGYDCIYDYEEQYLYLWDLWKKFFNGTVTDTDIYTALKDVDVLIDGPTILFWSEIYHVFPDAKVILTMRDENGWWKSFKRMNDRMFEKPWLRSALLLSPTGYRLGSYANKAFAYAFGIEVFRAWNLNWSANERLYKLKYRMHNCHVLQTVPKEKMLIHRSADGWGSLCDYLELEQPEIPYPHQNKNASLFHEDAKKSVLLRKIMKETAMTVSCFICVAVVSCYFFI